MFTTYKNEKLLFTLIGTLLFLCLFSTIGCNGKYQEQITTLGKELEEVKSNLDIALERVETAEDAKKVAENAQKVAKSAKEVAENAQKVAKSAKETAESKLETALQRAEAAENAQKVAETDREIALQHVKAAEGAKKIAEGAKKIAEAERRTALQRAGTAENARKIAEAERRTALQRAEAAEGAKKIAEAERRTALQRAGTAENARKIAENAKAKAETDRYNALKLAEDAEQERKNLEKLVSLVPQAEIKDVRIQEKGRNINISVTFSIKNRKDIEGSVKVFFFFKKNGRALRDKDGPISISEKFMPKRVPETLTVKLSISHAKLNLAQPSDLIFKFRIYDKPTDSFLDMAPYVKEFYFDPHKN